VKKRFGVSISEDSFSKLEEVVKKQGVSRSFIVETAIGSYLSAIAHEKSAHQCCGLVIVTRKKAPHEGLSAVLPEDLVVAETHLHDEDKCIVVSLVKGSSERIEEAVARASRLGVKALFWPLH